jgi:hypothetical protein
MKVCKRIEGEDVGDTSRAGTLFGPTLLRAASRRGGTLRRIGMAQFPWPGWSELCSSQLSICCAYLYQSYHVDFSRTSNSTVASLFLKPLDHGTNRLRAQATNRDHRDHVRRGP